MRDFSRQQMPTEEEVTLSSPTLKRDRITLFHSTMYGIKRIFIIFANSEVKQAFMTIPSI